MTESPLAVCKEHGVEQILPPALKVPHCESDAHGRDQLTPAFEGSFLTTAVNSADWTIVIEVGAAFWKEIDGTLDCEFPDAFFELPPHPDIIQVRPTKSMKRMIVLFTSNANSLKWAFIVLAAIRSRANAECQQNY